MNWPDPDAPKPSWALWAETPIDKDIDDIDDVDDVNGKEFPDPMRSDDAAIYLDIAPSTVNRLVQRGELRATVGPGRGRPNWFRRIDLDGYRKKQMEKTSEKGRP